MPVDFLTDEQARRYCRFNADPTSAQLSRYFYLDDGDRQEITVRRGDYNRLGYAIQLCTVRFLGTFLPEPTAVPRVVIAYLAKQLGIASPSCLARYRERVETHHAHATEIERRHCYRDSHQQPEHFRLVRWLYTRAWVSAERPIALFELTTARLVKRKILLPGVTKLTRLVASVRGRAAARLWRILAQLPSPLQRGRLLSLLQPAEGSARYSLLDRLRRAPTRISAAEMLGDLLQFHQRSVLRLPWHRDPGNASRFPLRLGWFARAPDRIAAPPTHDRLGRLFRHRLWAVLAPGISIQSALGRARRGSILANRSQSGLRYAKRAGTPSSQNGPDYPSIGTISSG